MKAMQRLYQSLLIRNLVFNGLGMSNHYHWVCFSIYLKFHLLFAALALLVFPFMPYWIGFWLAIILQQVSRLLSAIFVLSSSSKTFSLPNYSKVLSESHWASFFHQASLGNNLNYQFLSNTTPKHRTQNFADDQVNLHAYHFTL